MFGVNCSDPNSYLSISNGCLCKNSYSDIGVGCRQRQPYQIFGILHSAIEVLLKLFKKCANQYLENAFWNQVRIFLRLSQRNFEKRKKKWHC